MPRNYIRKETLGEIPKDVYMRVHWLLRGYERMKRERLDIIWSSSPQNGMPKAKGNASPTEAKAIKLASIENELQAIDQSAVEVRGEYSSATEESFDPIKAYFSYDYFNASHKRKSEDDLGPSEKTWRRFKQYFSVKIAKKAKLF